MTAAATAGNKEPASNKIFQAGFFFLPYSASSGGNPASCRCQATMSTYFRFPIFTVRIVPSAMSLRACERLKGASSSTNRRMGFNLFWSCSCDTASSPIDDELAQIFIPVVAALHYICFGRKIGTKKVWL
jgi:hypothetical protein